MHHYSENKNEDSHNNNNNKNKMFRNKSLESEHDNSNSNANFQFSFKNFFKGLFIVSLPHLTLISIFLIYLIVGSAILREIESNKQIDSLKSNSKIISADSNKNGQQINQQASSKNFVDFNELNAKLRSHQTSFNNMKSNYLGFSKDLLNIHEKLKSNQEQIVLNNQEFLKECNKIVKKQFNSSELMKETGMNFNHNLKANNTSDLEGVKFIADLYEKQKKNINPLNIFKSIAKNLLDYKNGLKSTLNKSLKALIESFLKKQTTLKRKLTDLLTEQETIIKKNQDFMASFKLDEILIDQNDVKVIEEKQIEQTSNNNEEVKNNNDNNNENNENENKSDDEENNQDNLETVESNIFFKQKQNIDWQFSTSLYFMGSLLTTIGYGDVSPQTILGKVFTMIYLITGVPLTLILLADLGSIFTRFVKFLYAFLSILYDEGYFESLRKRRLPFVAGLFSFFFSSKSSSKKEHKKRGDTENEEDRENEGQSSFNAICEIALNCMENNDDTFDLSLGFLFTVVFIYLSFGAIVSSRIANWSLFNGYYFSLISLTKIGLGDLVISNTKFMLLSCGYTLFGLAFFDLTVNCLQEKLRLIIVRNGQNAFNEIIKFFNQLGYNWSSDSVNFNLAIASNYKLSTKMGLIETITNNNDPQDTHQNDSNFSSDSSKTHKIMKKIKSINDYGGYYINDVTKCDKQTQITTLLCSKLKLEKTQSLEALYNPTVAPIKPNTKASLVSYKSHEILDYNPIKEEEEEKIAEKVAEKPNENIETKLIVNSTNVEEKETPAIENKKYTESVTFTRPSKTPSTTSTTSSNEQNNSNKSDSNTGDGNDLASIRLRRANRFSSSTSSTTPSFSSNSSTSTITSSSTTYSGRIIKSSRFN